MKRKTVTQRNTATDAHPGKHTGERGSDGETNKVYWDLHNLIAATDIGVIFVDRELRVQFFTPRVEQLFNIRSEDISSLLADIEHCLNCDDLPAECAKVLLTKTSAELEIQDNKDNTYLVRLFPYRRAEDQIEGVVVTFFDITERLQREERLRWLSTVIESSNDAIFSFAFDRKIVTWNTGAEQIFGYMAKEAIGRPLSMLTRPGGEKEQDKFLATAWSGEAVENLETVQLNKDGVPIDISLTVAPIKDENEKVVGLSATVRDITKGRKSDEKLRESQELQRLLIESAKDFAMFTLTVDGKVNSWNTGAERVFGYTEDEIMGQYGGILFTPEDRALGIPEQEMENAATKGRGEDERYHIRKDGSRFYASGVMTPLLDGGLHGFAKVARDLTTHRRADEKLRRIQDELQEGLEAKVAERTVELARSAEALRLEIADRLRAEQERVALLRRIVTTQEEERGRLARDLHDQLGQRLTALRLKIASLKELCGDNEEFSIRVARLEEIGEELDAEVSFLAWEMRPAVLDDLGLVVAVNNYVMEWSRHFSIPAAFESAGLKKAERLGPETETNLYRICQEALNNICKHAQATHVSVLLERRKDIVVLIVEDDGVGFRPARKARVNKKRNGMGLTSMRERAAIEGGTIEIESATGKGTTVFVRMPFEPAKRQNEK